MINLFQPCIGQEEIDAVTQVLKSGWLGMGPRVKEFEDKFAAYIGVPHAVALNSCTSALEMALRLLDVGPGDEVLVPTMTFVSTAHAVKYVGATPVFCDIDPETLLISWKDLRDKISDKTAAIIVVHLAGRVVDIKTIQTFYPNIPIIEDCAHACGSFSNRDEVMRAAGSLGTIGTFSFQAVKNLCTGDGGMITLRDPELDKRARKFRWLGIDKGTWSRSAGENKYLWEYNVEEIGYKWHMNDINAAIGIEQLKKLPVMNHRRKEIEQHYRDGLAKIPEISLPPEDSYSRSTHSSWHIFWIQTTRRDDLMEHFRNKGIAAGVHYKPIHLYPCYGPQPSLPIAEQVCKNLISLPMHPGLSDKDVRYVIDCIKEFYNA